MKADAATTDKWRSKSDKYSISDRSPQYHSSLEECENKRKWKQTQCDFWDDWTAISCFSLCVLF
jgi:hypothetical protein